MRSWNYTKLECTRVLCEGSTYEKLHTTRSPPIYERAIHQYENVSDLSIQWWVVARCNWHYSSVTIIKLLIRIYNQIILMLKITQFSSQLLLNNCTVCCNYQTSLVLCFDDIVWLWTIVMVHSCTKPWLHLLNRIRYWQCYGILLDTISSDREWFKVLVSRFQLYGVIELKIYILLLSAKVRHGMYLQRKWHHSNSDVIVLYNVTVAADVARERIALCPAAEDAIVAKEASAEGASRAQRGTSQQ